jgi:hypothetical protein
MSHPTPSSTIQGRPSTIYTSPQCHSHAKQSDQSAHYIPPPESSTRHQRNPSVSEIIPAELDLYLQSISQHRAVEMSVVNDPSLNSTLNPTRNVLLEPGTQKLQELESSQRIRTGDNRNPLYNPQQQRAVMNSLP